MTIFSFLMIMQSIIIGVGISELLTGVARILRRYPVKEIGFIVPVAALMIFLALLQMFWESWGLRDIETWTFLAMVLMLSGPILLHLMAHILFPPDDVQVTLNEYYFEKTKIIWSIASLTAIVSVIFRPLAFDMPLLIVNNLTSLPILIVFLFLIVSKNIWLHRILISSVVIMIIADTLTISYQIH